MSYRYPSIVAASVAGERSLAEALATDIPASTPPSEINEHISRASSEASSVTGSPISYSSWVRYRLAALFVRSESGSYEWAEATVNTHYEASTPAYGITLDELRQNPRAVADRRAARREEKSAALVVAEAERLARVEANRIVRAAAAVEHEADKPARAAAATEATLAALDRGPSPERAPAEPLGSWAIDERAAASARERLRTSGQVSVATIERESSSTRAGGSAGLVRIVRQYLADFVDLTDEIERKIVRDELASILAELDSE